MSKLSRNKQFFLSLLVPVIILIAMTVKPLLTVLTGETIYLQTTPVDPSDLAYGDYVDLEFEIETVPLDLLDNGLKKQLGDDKDYFNFDSDKSVYITIKQNKNTNIYEVLKVTETKPRSGIFIKGKLAYYIDQAWDNNSSTKEAHINIPIERYYVEDNTGTHLEKLSQKGKLRAEIKVRDGYAVLRGITVID
ncbi:GDYXXLXY domain-containing protein [Rummeliibacillus sp. NPDC094406]|uniref:GDYXXLXY domain-containing protein n=1 Tax=Rummeliibacillus sp. NPDC094406 TaxID=3364511 RepID=UPI0037F9AA3A